MVPLRENGRLRPGIEVGKKIRKIGMMSSDTYQMQQFQEERLWCAANAIQSLTNCIEQTIAYTGERMAFGKAVLDNQSVHFKLAELKTEVESLRALTYMATEHYLAGQDVTEWASMAKLKAGRLMRTVPDACLQFWGGMG